MRGSFNTTVDVYSGPDSGSPGAFVGTFDCRYVVEDGIQAIGLDHIPIPAYFTVKDYQPVGMWDSPYLSINPGLSDQVAFAPLGLITHWVIYVDEIIWGPQAPYFRAYLSPLPLPDGRPFGWIEVSGQAAIVSGSGAAHAGVVEVSGVAGVSPLGGFGRYGDVQLDGQAAIVPGGGVPSIGDLEISGAGNSPIVGGGGVSGALEVLGLAAIAPGGTVARTGEVEVSGQAAIAPGGTVARTGEVEVSGQAAIAPGGTVARTGEVEVSGQAAIAPGGTVARTGEVEVSGQAAITFAWTHRFDFLTGQHGWFTDFFGTYSAGVGFLHTMTFAGPDYYSGARIDLTAPSTFTLTKMAVRANFTRGQDPLSIHNWSTFHGTPAPSGYIDYGPNAPADGLQTVGGSSVSLSIADYIGFQALVGYNPSAPVSPQGEIVIVWIDVSGTGPMPTFV